MKKIDLSLFEDAVVLAELEYEYNSEHYEYIKELCQTTDGMIFIHEIRYLFGYYDLEWANDTFYYISAPDLKELLIEHDMDDLYESLFDNDE